jgi:hypothetical protein
MHKAVQVECYSGSRYGERPLSFILDDERYVVKAVEKSWRTPSVLHFRVRTEDDQSFELAYREKTDEWHIGRPPMEAQE